LKRRRERRAATLPFGSFEELLIAGANPHIGPPTLTTFPATPVDALIGLGKEQSYLVWRCDLHARLRIFVGLDPQHDWHRRISF